jgi:hypothetical protein
VRHAYRSGTSRDTISKIIYYDPSGNISQPELLLFHGQNCRQAAPRIGTTKVTTKYLFLICFLGLAGAG